MVVGENESTNREAWSEEHRGDRDSLDLLGAQNELVKAVVETGKPVIVLLINGRPLSVNYIAEHAQGIFEGWYLGEDGRAGVCRGALRRRESGRQAADDVSAHGGRAAGFL